jgi:hypothetical protein
MHAEIIPETLPDESLYSLIARLGRINGYSPELTCRFLLGNLSELRIAEAEVDLSIFTAATQSLYGSAMEVLQKHTNFKFRNTITTPLLQGQNSNKWARLLFDAKANLAELSNHEEHIWRWCPQCLKHDQEYIGFTYWRVKHQLPGVFVCSDHRTTLHEVNIPFQRRQKNFFFPDHLPLDISVLSSCPNDIHYELAIRLCNISESILDCTELNINQAMFRQTIKNGFATKGLITKAGLIHKDASIAFERFYESLKDIKEVLLLTKHHLFEKQAKALFNHSEIRLNRPLIIPMLILWLYGNWQLFKNAYEWEVSLSGGAEQLFAKPIKAKVSSSESVRSLCKGFILENPQCVRKDFYKLHQRYYRFLQKYDREWFEKILPSPPPHKSRQFKLFK